jgi:transposase
MLEPEGQALRRVEVITGSGRRRRFSDDDKARIVEETLVPGAVVSEVARRHGLTPQQVFTWRRQARTSASPGSDREAPAFVPAVLDAPVPASAPHRRRTKRARTGDGDIEVTIDGVTVRVGRGADAKTIAAVIRALRAGT